MLTIIIREVKTPVEMETFNLWAKMPIFNTSSFIFQLQLQMALQKQQKT